MSTIKVLLISLLIHLCIFAQPTIEKVKNLKLEKKENSLVYYFSSGYETEADGIAELLNKSRDYFSESFSVHESFSLAVLDENDWVNITKIPYGLPFVSGPPYIVIIPANSKHELGHLVLSSIESSGIEQKYSMNKNEISSLFISLIGFHELGHIYAREYGINFPNKWTFEFAATYFAYLYLNKTAPDKNKFWLDVGKELLNEIKPNHTSLEDFEDLYVRVGVENYAWYQVVFLKQVAEAANDLGKDFIYKLRENGFAESGNFFLQSLEKIQPGFMEWAKKYNLL